MTSPEPPAYDPNQQASGQLPGSQDFTLILDGRVIYPSEPPSRILYQLSSAPCFATAKVYAVEKVRYRLSENDGEGHVKSRLDHIYDFQTKYFHSLRDVRPPVVIDGKTSRKRAYKSIMLSPSAGAGWSTCSAEGHFKATVSISSRLKGGNGQILWKNTDGLVVAVETRPKRKEDGNLETLPRLEVKVALEEKDLDLLVTCWAARLWKEASKELKQPLTWKDCESSCLP